MAVLYQLWATVLHAKKSNVSEICFISNDWFSGYRYACIWTLGIGCLTSSIVTLTPGLDNKRYNSFRASMFVFLGLSAGAPLIIMQYHPEHCLNGFITPFALGGLVYIVGAIIYVTGYPERLVPGHFDMCGASHQIFHFCVLVACCIHYFANYRAYIMNQSMICPAWSEAEPLIPMTYETVCLPHVT